MRFTITGTNDAPEVSDTADPTAVVELCRRSGTELRTPVSGSFDVSDQDVGDAHCLGNGRHRGVLSGVHDHAAGRSRRS